MNLLCTNRVALLSVLEIKAKGCKVDLEKMPDGNTFHVKDGDLKWKLKCCEWIQKMNCVLCRCFLNCFKCTNICFQKNKLKKI